MFGNKKATRSTLLLIALFNVLGQHPSAMAITSDELADICQKMESAFVDITADYETGVEPPPSFENAEMPNILITKGPTVRNWSSKRPFDEVFLSIEKSTVVDNKGNSFNSTIMQSCDGKISRYLTKGGLSSTGEEVDFSRGVITNDKRFSLPFTVTPIAYSVLRFSYDHEKIPLSKRLQKSDFVRLNNNIENINGFNSICVELLWDAPNVPILHKQQTQFRIYFSKDHGYTPIRYDLMQPAKEGPEITSQVQVKSLEKISDNLWFPSKGYSKNLRSNLTNTYEASKIVVNKDLKDEDFKVEFPAGTKVDNKIEGITYVTTDSEEKAKEKVKNEKQAQEQKNTLPGFEGIDIEFNPEQAKGKNILLCFFDYQQRPSRNLVRELAKQANEIEKKGIVVLLVHTSDIKSEVLDKWIEENNIPFACGRITGESQKVLHQWGVKSLPWLILTDRDHVVTNEGLGINELKEKIGAIK